VSPSASRGAIPPAPRIVSDHLRFGATRKAETAAYAARHYGERTARLRPTMIVLHYSESDTYASVRSLFEADQPSRGEAPGTCAHYVVEQDGTIHELVPPSLICRHTVGLNHVAIGIEDVGISDAEILHDRAQLRSALALTAWLVGRFHIRIRNVIGHNESLSSPYHRELYRPWAHQTHGDWKHYDMDVFRSKLRVLLRSE